MYSTSLLWPVPEAGKTGNRKVTEKATLLWKQCTACHMLFNVLLLPVYVSRKMHLIRVDFWTSAFFSITAVTVNCNDLEQLVPNYFWRKLENITINFSYVTLRQSSQGYLVHASVKLAVMSLLTSPLLKIWWNHSAQSLQLSMRITTVQRYCGCFFFSTSGIYCAWFSVGNEHSCNPKEQYAHCIWILILQNLNLPISFSFLCSCNK